MTPAIFRETGVLGPEDCAAVRRAMDGGLTEQAEILEAGIQRREKVRLASLIEPPAHIIDLVEFSFERRRRAIATALGLPLGDREGAGFIRYPAGGFYRPHVDRGNDPAWPPASRRIAAVVLFLNTSRDTGLAGEFDGGLLRLRTDEGVIDIVPEAGSLVAFSADLVHEVTEVQGGERDTVVDWFYR